MTWEKIRDEMNDKVKTPGMANIFWMPIQTRTEMLTTGFRTKLGIKVFGHDLGTIQDVAVQIEKALSDFPDTRSAFAERTTGGYFLDVDTARWTHHEHRPLRRAVDDDADVRFGCDIGGWRH